jgi:integrase
MTLSAIACARAKPRDKIYKLFDEKSMYLLVHPNGSRYWRMNYRFAGKARTLALGVFPEISLAEARELRTEARRLLREGLDPSAHKREMRARKALVAVNTFQAVAEEWLEKRQREGLSEVTLGKLKWLLGFAYPLIGSRPIAEITSFELLQALRVMETGGRHESARRLRSVCGRVFRYAIATCRAENDVSAHLREAITVPRTKHYAAITDPEQVGELLRAIDGYDRYQVTRLALQLAPHVFLRPGELRQAMWDEIDLNKAVWSIPAEKMKMRRPHRVPLSRQSLAILEQLKEIGGGKWPHVFPGYHQLRKPMSENALNSALRHLGYSGDRMTPHGFRAMASTLLNETGKWHPDAIERQLAHADTNAVRRAYVRGEYWEERVRMMQDWSDYLDELRRRSSG